MNQRKLKQNDTSEAQIYKNSLDCIMMVRNHDHLVNFYFKGLFFILLLFQTLRTEGFLALYRGFIPNFVRLCPWNIVVSLFRNK